MEAEEHKNDPEEEIKLPKRVKLTMTKIREISNRMLEPTVEEQRARDIRKVIRAIKDPDLVIKGSRKEAKQLEEESAPQQRKKSQLDKTKDSLHSLYKLPGTDIKLTNAQADTIGFLECMSGPRFPDFDETESDTTFERLSYDEESLETQSLLELLKSDQEEEDAKEQAPLKSICKNTVPDVVEEEVEKGKENEEVKKPEVAKKPKLKRWKPRIKNNPMRPDPLISECAEGVTDYLSEIGIFSFMKDWLYHLYGLNPRPKDPVKLLRAYLEESLNDGEKESDVSQLEKELQDQLKKEDDITVEISKLIHLAHLLAPEIYDADGNMISHEPSVEEEQFVIEEEPAATPSVEHIENIPTNLKARKGSAKSRTALKQKGKGKQSNPNIYRTQSKTVKSTTKLKKKKSIAKIPVKGK